MFCTIDKLSWILRYYVMNNRINGKALHKPSELLKGKLTQILRASGPGEAACFNSLVEKQKAITFPEQALNLLGGSPAEEEE